MAVLKLYGPNKRNENSVLVTKSKESDIKFVTILAEKVVKLAKTDLRKSIGEFLTRTGKQCSILFQMLTVGKL